MAIKDRPLFTDVFNNATAFSPKRQSIYVYSASQEQRSELVSSWIGSSSEVIAVNVIDQNSSSVVVDIGGVQQSINLRSSVSMSDFLNSFSYRLIYIDITGLNYSTWAPILKTAHLNHFVIKGVYVEPAEYKFSASPTEGEIFDLSERIAGISPIPGFATLSEPHDDDVCFVALLGFEGPRFAYMIEQIQPPGRKIFPIIGVPGFQPQFPFYTYLGNRFSLTQSFAWPNVRYAIANCPFSAYYALKDIADSYPSDSLKVAPIGTKPHGLGAVMFNIVSSRSVELVYDHPVRKPDRTNGALRLLLYHLSTFMSPVVKTL